MPCATWPNSSGPSARSSTATVRPEWLFRPAAVAYAAPHHAPPACRCAPPPRLTPRRKPHAVPEKPLAAPPWPDPALSLGHARVRFHFRAGGIFPGRAAGGIRQGDRHPAAGQLALADAGEPVQSGPGALVRPATAALAAALCHPDGAPAEPVFRLAVLCPDHQLGQRPTGVYRPARPVCAAGDHRPAVLQLAGTAALAVPGLPQPDSVCRAAHRPADHPASNYRAELSAGPGLRRAAVLPEPARHPAHPPLVALVGLARPEPGAARCRLAGTALGATSHPVAQRSGGQQPDERRPAHAGANP